jgi:putative transposase
MSKSHTNTRHARDTGAELKIIPGLGLADLAGSGLPERLAGKVEGELELFADRMRHGLLAAAVAVGLQVFDELLQTEVTEIAGVKGRHNSARTAVRHGIEPAKVPMGGRLIDVAKPRVRAVDGTGEIGLETWAALADRDLLGEHTLVSMLAGVSTRNYATVLEPAGPDVVDASSSTSKSAVSRRFVKATAARLVEFRSRPLDDRRWAVVYIDGFGFGDQTMVGALGVDEAGNKVPLTVMQGTTENKTVVTRLLNNLEERGLTADDGLLFVIDGGLALFHAIRGHYGEQALIQRCRVHKLKNILDLLPGEHHAWVKRDLNRAWNDPDAGAAERALRALAVKIRRTHPDAAASLEEGLVETVTINRLGIDGRLARTLATTNPMESTVDIIRTHARNVKRWMDGDMRLRWAAAGMLAAEGQYRRIKGCNQMPAFVAALYAATRPDGEPHLVAVAS